MENLKPQLIQPDQTSPFGFTDTNAANSFASFTFPILQTRTRTRTRTRIPGGGVVATSTPTPLFGASPSDSQTVERSSIPMATPAISDPSLQSNTVPTSRPSATTTAGAAAGFASGEQPITSSHNTSGGMSGGEIAAAVVVPVVVVIAALGILAFFLVRRRRRTRVASYVSNEPRSPMETRQMSQAPQLPPLVIPPKAIPTGSQFGTGSNTLQNSPQMKPAPMPTLPEKYNTAVTATHASSGASSVLRDPFETPVGSEERRNGYLDAAGDISPVNEPGHRISTIDEVHNQRGADEMSNVSDLSYQDEDEAEVSVAQRASVIHMGTGSGNSPRGSTGHAVTPQ